MTREIPSRVPDCSRLYTPIRLVQAIFAQSGKLVLSGPGPTGEREVPNTLNQGIVLTLSAEPLDLPAGPLKLLLRLRQLAGKARRITTYTQSLATLFERTTNTIRAWRNVLVEAGYIHWVTNQRTGQTSIYITELVEPPSRRALIQEQQRLDALPSLLPWQKPRPRLLKEHRPWWRLPTDSVFCVGGAKLVALIKVRKILPPEELSKLAQKWGLTLI